MRLAVGLSVHTGWAACIVAGGSIREPHVAAREHVEILGDPGRFVFHRAAEARAAQAAGIVKNARAEAFERAHAVLARLARDHDVRTCAVIAKQGEMLPLEEVLSAHPRIHTAEGRFYRDVLCEAAGKAGMSAKIVPPTKLDANDPRLAKVGEVVGKPWNRDWKLAALAAWHALGGQPPG